MIKRWSKGLSKRESVYTRKLKSEKERARE